MSFVQSLTQCAAVVTGHGTGVTGQSASQGEKWQGGQKITRFENKMVDQELPLRRRPLPARPVRNCSAANIVCRSSVPLRLSRASLQRSAAFYESLAFGDKVLELAFEAFYVSVRLIGIGEGLDLVTKICKLVSAD